MVRTHGIGARIVLSGQNQIIKKYKESLLPVSLVTSVKQKKNEGIAQNSKLIFVTPAGLLRNFILQIILRRFSRKPTVDLCPTNTNENH